MKSIYQKIADCKKIIKESKHKKEGKNSYSNYDYFTPGQVEQLVYEACLKESLMTKFDLVRNEHGITGKLTIIDLETPETVVYQMASDVPEIKATNIAQQLGGCMTYTERYLKMTAFGITDNNLDFDTTENTEKSAKKVEEEKIEWLTEEQFNIALKSDSKGITAVLNTYNTKTKRMKKSFNEALLIKLNQLKNESNNII